MFICIFRVLLLETICENNFQIYIPSGLSFVFVGFHEMEEEASIPQHASETSGSLQTLYHSFTSRQVYCLYI